MKYDAEYSGGQFGRTTVRVVAPKNMNAQEKEKVLESWRQAFIAGWNTLSEESKLVLSRNNSCSTNKT